TFTGCAGNIQRNERDVTISPVHYRLADDERAFPFQVCSEEKIVMTSAYDVIQETHVTDILKDAQHIFSPALYLSIIGMIAFLSVLFMIFTMIHSGRHKNLWEIFWEFLAAFMHQGSDSLDLHALSVRILFVCLYIFSFFILAIWSNLLSTDAVVARKAEVINTFEDFLKRPNVMPYFFYDIADWRHFENAPKGS